MATTNIRDTAEAQRSQPNRRTRLHTPAPRIPRWASVKETADYLGLTDRTIRQMQADGRLLAYSNGKKVLRFDLNEVDDAMHPHGGAA